MALKLHHVRREAKVDYLGAATIVGAVTSLILYLSWAGPDEGWTSTIGIALLAATVVLIALFVVSSVAPPSRSCRCSCSPTGPSPPTSPSRW